uniref:DNA-directed RNA polymerase III subunit RPC9 n=1 Tax=Rhodnius prolixus TaxID=13249 RepID=T1HVK8_RHOPR
MAKNGIGERCLSLTSIVDLKYNLDLVFCLLNDCKETIVIRSKTGNQFATILYEASQYLQNNLAGQTEQDVKNMMTALLHFPVPLTHDEKLMIVNTLPRTPLELSVVKKKTL